MTRDNQSNTAKKSSSDLKLGEILVLEKYLSKRDIEKALSLQREEESYKDLPLGVILTRLGAVSEADIDEALKQPGIRKNLGSLVLKKGLVKKDDLKKLLKSKQAGQFTGELLVSYGYLTHREVAELLEEQNNAPHLGRVLVEGKLITEKTLQKALGIQKSRRALGEILCGMDLMEAHDLNYILRKYKKEIGIEKILVKLGFLDQDKLKYAKKKAREKSEPIEAVLLKQRLVTSEQLQIANAKKYNFPFLNLPNFVYSETNKRELTLLISRKYSEKNLVIPLYVIDQHLTIAVFNPAQINLSRELMELYPKLTISTAFVSEEKFEELFEILYSKRLRDDALDTKELAVSDDMDFLEINLEENINETITNAPEYGQDIEADEIVNFIIKYGILHNASDIHIEQDRENQKLRYRIDGLLQETTVGWLRNRVADKIGAIISRIKVLSNMDIAEKRLPQDGVFRIKYFNKIDNKKFDLDFRVASCRAIEGENVTIRILDSRKANVGIDNLGHSPHVLEPAKRLLKSSAGMVLVSGPTGSGKSSSLYGALRYLYSPDKKIITAEDPIEYSFPGIMQTQVNPRIQLTFSRLLRSFLRQDPDVILVGEVRDEETAAIAFDAAQTGHLLLSTIHTNDSISAVSRLIDLNVEYSQMATCLLAVVAQRLVRRICPICKENYIPDEQEWSMFFDDYPFQLEFFQGKGCEACSFSGYKGRTLISEIFTVDKQISQLLSKGSSEGEIRRIAESSGMKSMIEDGISKLREITLSEIIRVVPNEMIAGFKAGRLDRQPAPLLPADTDRHNSRPADPEPSFESFLLSGKKQQAATINKIYQSYSRMQTEDSGRGVPDPAAFEKLIRDSAQNTCAAFHCKKVRFTVRKNDNRADIAVLPEA